MIIHDDVNTKELFLDHSSKFEGWPKNKWTLDQQSKQLKM